MLNKLSLRMKVALFSLIICIALLGCLALLENFQQGRVYQKLTVALEDKREAVNNFFDKHITNIQSLSEEQYAIDLMTNFQETYATEGVESDKPFKDVARRVSGKLNGFAGRNRYQNLFFVSPDGTIIYELKKQDLFSKNLQTDESIPEQLIQTYEKVKDDGIAISDLTTFSQTKREAMFLGKTIEKNGELIGVVFVEWTTDIINRVIARPMKIVETEDYYLVGSDYTLRTDSRLIDDPTVLTKAVETKAVKEALEMEGLSEIHTITEKGFRDYSVLEAYAPVKALGLKWVIVTEAKAQEALALATQLRYLVFFLMACMAVVIIFWDAVPKKYKQKNFWVETGWAYLYLIPIFVILGIFVFYPVVKSFMMSFYKWDLIGNRQFLGLDNFKELIGDRIFRKAILNTSYFVFVSVPITITLSLFVAILLNTKLKARSWYRMAFFVPWITSPVAATMVWKWIFNYNSYGLLNYMLLKGSHILNWFAKIFTLGNVQEWLHFIPIDWLNAASLTIPNLILLSVWKMMGYNIVIFLAGLQNVPNELYEAAEVDGASRWQKFKNITLPLISPTTFFISVISIIGAFKIFTQVFVLYNGGAGPLNSGMTMVFYVYSKAFGEWRMGYASAGAYVLFFIIFLFTMIQMQLSKKRVHYS